MKKYRKVDDHEISPYQGWGDKKAMQKAQSRKRRQVRRNERSVFDDLPEEYQGAAKAFFWIALLLIFIFPLLALV